jgi:hypothetical protein
VLGVEQVERAAVLAEPAEPAQVLREVAALEGEVHLMRTHPT